MAQWVCPSLWSPLHCSGWELHCYSLLQLWSRFVCSSVLLIFSPLLFLFFLHWIIHLYYVSVQSQLLDYDTHCFPLIRYDSVYFPCKMYFNPKGILLPSSPLTLYYCYIRAVAVCFISSHHSNYLYVKESLHQYQHSRSRVVCTWLTLEPFPLPSSKGSLTVVTMTPSLISYTPSPSHYFQS